jgi:hypothetical protein
VVSDLVAHDLHDVVAVGDETKRQGSGQNSELPDGNGSLRLGGATGAPSTVDDGPGTDSVTDIVGTVGERSGTGSENLDEGVCVLDLVGVFLSMAVDTLHTGTFGGSVDTSLSSVNIVVDTVETTDNDHGRDTLKSDDDVLLLVNLTSADLVLVEVSHGPGKRTLLGTELGVEAFLALFNELLVAELAVFSNDSALLGVLLSGNDTMVRVAKRSSLHVLVMLDDSVVANVGTLGTLSSRSAEQERSLESMVPADGVIALDNNGV